ncbi:MAG TPA: sigma-70 family RNA polymerase sigma factor [Allosphingosinicella sp.]|jgi:RNA polymerase sigma factor for flagellar operon FliA
MDNVPSLLPDPAEAERALWDAFRARDSAAAREKLFALYLPFARSVAGRHFRRGGAEIEFGDLHQLACAGLLEALDRFDPALGVPFRAYAGRRIAGSILSGIAKMSEVREQISFRNRVRRERTASLASLGAEALPAPEALEALIEVAVGLAIGFMLEGTALYVGEPERDPPGAYDGLVWEESIRRITAEVDRLPEREQGIIRFHYLKGVPFEEIAAAFGLSKGRISQLHKGALALLRKRLGRSGFRLER